MHYHKSEGASTCSALKVTLIRRRLHADEGTDLEAVGAHAARDALPPGSALDTKQEDRGEAQAQRQRESNPPTPPTSRGHNRTP